MPIRRTKIQADTQLFDQLFKELFSRQLRWVIRFFYKEAEMLFDLDRKIELLDKELRQVSSYTIRHSTRVDLLGKVFLKGSEEYILLLIEIQGNADRRFNIRIYNYYTDVQRKYGDKVSVKVLLTDSNKSFRPGNE